MAKTRLAPCLFSIYRFAAKRPAWLVVLSWALLGSFPFSLSAQETGQEAGAEIVRRLSAMGLDGDIETQARNSSVACSPTSNRCLVVWESDVVDNVQANEEFEIFAQLVNSDGAEIGADDFRISFQGGDGDNHDNERAVVVWNADDNEFLVVWQGHGEATIDLGGLQIWGQRVSAATGALTGGNFRVSELGPPDIGFDVAAVYNSALGEYLVTWWGNVPDIIGVDFEIHGMRLSPGGLRLASALRLTQHAVDGDSNFVAEHPAIAWNSIDGTYLLVFEGTHSLEMGSLPVVEIYGQRLQSNATRLGDTFRISAMGLEGDATYDARDPQVVFNPSANQYLVVWSSADDGGALSPVELEIWGQRLNAAGSEIGEDDFRISFQGDDGDSFKDAERPALAYNPADGTFRVVWQAPTVMGIEELEIFTQRLSAAGALLGPATRLSFMGPEEDFHFAALRPAMAVNSLLGNFIVTWHGDDDTAPLVEDELEIFGLALGEAVGLIFLDGFESGDTSSWSMVSGAESG